MRTKKTVRRPPNAVHLADLAIAIERRVWFKIPDAAVSHTIDSKTGRPIFVVVAKGQQTRVDLRAFCVEEDSPWCINHDIEAMAGAVVDAVARKK